MSAAWRVSGHHGGAAEFHGLQPVVGPGDRLVWWFDVDRPALAIGSAQPSGTIDADACAAGGVDVVRRRSGGGAVLLIPGEIVWVDVVIGRDDPLWVDDVGRAMWWLGDVWVDALASLGIAGATVHRRPLQATPWSRVVCFDGVGPGEVLVDGRKAVGISQRRTRSFARMQCALHLAWRPADIAPLLAEPRPDPVELTPPFTPPLELATALTADPTPLRASFTAALPAN